MSRNDEKRHLEARAQAGGAKLETLARQFVVPKEAVSSVPVIERQFAKKRDVVVAGSEAKKEAEPLHQYFQKPKEERSWWGYIVRGNKDRKEFESYMDQGYWNMWANLTESIVWGVKTGTEGILDWMYPKLKEYKVPESQYDLPQIYKDQRQFIGKILEAQYHAGFIMKAFLAVPITMILIGALPLINGFAFPFVLPLVYVALLFGVKFKLDWIDRLTANGFAFLKFFGFGGPKQKGALA